MDEKAAKLKEIVPRLSFSTRITQLRLLILLMKHPPFSLFPQSIFLPAPASLSGKLNSSGKQQISQSVSLQAHGGEIAVAHHFWGSFQWSAKITEDTVQVTSF